ncbi:hypothetical protein [Rhodococcus sp. UFZ-B548]|uniref:hypothetical protein n=1 Tax=Rhodococcus sp. UFZ-B548 TaxID=2742212 RepID=UPI0015F43890|nr:hypothetical protein [Rhodococcus sp. UFZ-B548]
MFTPPGCVRATMSLADALVTIQEYAAVGIGILDACTLTEKSAIATLRTARLLAGETVTGE